MRFLIVLLFALLTGCMTYPPPRYVQTFTGPVQIPAPYYPTVNGGVSVGHGGHVGGWITTVIGGRCYISPTVTSGGGKPNSYVQIAC